MSTQTDNRTNTRKPGTIAFIGLGLIGGSIAKAIRKFPRRYRLIAWNPHPERVDDAIRDGVIDEKLDSLTDPLLSEADIIYLCAPVEKNCENLETILPLINDSAIVTDIGSVKTNIHEAAIRLGIEDRFVGGHPMAGSERTGYYASKDHLLENAYYIITASAGADEARVRRMSAFAAGIDAIPIRMDYKEHDRVVAAVSHVPHVIAASLVHLVEDNDNPEHLMKTIAAGGFKDITRIASSCVIPCKSILRKGSFISNLPLSPRYYSSSSAISSAVSFTMSIRSSMVSSASPSRSETSSCSSP